MAKLVQRRSIRRDDPEAKGPGGALIPLFASLTLVGWLSIAAGAAYVALQIVPPLVSGAAIDVEWLGSLAAAVVLGRAATMLLPAAVQFGFPRVGRRNPRLLLGLVLLAGAQVVFLVAQGVGGWVLRSLYEQPVVEGGLDPTTVAQVVLTVFSLAYSTVEILGWAWVYRGLRAAGASVTRRVVASAVTAAMAAEGVTYAWLLVVYMGPSTSEVSIGLVFDILAIGLGLGSLGATMAVAVLLVAGFRQRLVPRSAWGAGAVYGILTAVVLILGIVGMVGRVLSGEGRSDAAVSIALGLPGLAAPFLLLAAFALGLGRGTQDRQAPARTVARHWVTGGRRFRETPA